LPSPEQLEEKGYFNRLAIKYHLNLALLGKTPMSSAAEHSLLGGQMFKFIRTMPAMDNPGKTCLLPNVRMIQLVSHTFVF
jgi:hypothetical protein